MKDVNNIKSVTVGCLFAIILCLNTYAQTNSLKLPYFEDFKKAFPVRDKPGNDTDLLIKRVGKEVKEYYDRTSNRNSCALRVSVGLNNAGFKIPSNQFTFEGKDSSQNFLGASDLLAWMKLNFTPTKKIIVTENMRENGNELDQITSLKGIYMMIPVDNIRFGASGHADLFDEDCDGGCFEYDAAEIYFWELPKRPIQPRRNNRPSNGR